MSRDYDMCLDDDEDDGYADVAAVWYCEHHLHHLNDWENDFILSVGEQLDAGRLLTQSQSEKLHELYDELMAIHGPV